MIFTLFFFLNYLDTIFWESVISFNTLKFFNKVVKCFHHVFFSFIYHLSYSPSDPVIPTYIQCTSSLNKVFPCRLEEKRDLPHTDGGGSWEFVCIHVSGITSSGDWPQDSSNNFIIFFYMVLSTVGSTFCIKLNKDRHSRPVPTFLASACAFNRLLLKNKR